jgi:hypothetical protein
LQGPRRVRPEGPEPRTGWCSRRRGRQQVHFRHAEDAPMRPGPLLSGEGQDFDGKRHERRARGTGTTVGAQDLREEEAEEGSGRGEG